MHVAKSLEVHLGLMLKGLTHLWCWMLAQSPKLYKTKKTTKRGRGALCQQRASTLQREIRWWTFYYDRRKQHFSQFHSFICCAVD